MQTHRWIASAVLLLAFLGIAAWQWHEYGHERELARETVVSSAEAVMKALVGGVRSHRRLGQFFSDQIQGVIDELVRSKDVQAAALTSEDGRTVLSAGDREQLHLALPFAPGGYWDAAGFRLVNEFHLPAETAGPGSGMGGGRGWGRHWQQEDPDTQGEFVPGKPAVAILVMSRERADAAIRQAAWTRGFIVLGGWVVTLCIALVWRATVRLAEARGRARTLEIEARHFRDLSQAAAGLAHETRNPLGLIRGWTQRLAETCINTGDGQKQAQAIMEECDRVTARINQFLAFARSSDPQVKPVDPAEVVGELAMLLEPDLNLKHLGIGRMAGGSTILADREMLRQALFNLLQNAIQASPERGTVETTLVHQRDGRFRLEVADRGVGVPRELVDKLFTPYFTTRPDGTGLGLAIVRRIAAAHGWKVGYAPRSGGGAIFWLGDIDG